MAENRHNGWRLWLADCFVCLSSPFRLALVVFSSSFRCFFAVFSFVIRYVLDRLTNNERKHNERRTRDEREVIEKRTKNGWVLDEICGQMYVYLTLYTVCGVEIYECRDFYVAHGIFFIHGTHRHTRILPPKRGIRAHFGQRFYLGVSCLLQNI